ncbi:helicase-associated domain-containing protein [Skeletonema marinoi]|uniref:Helicase-associated domain-containing protein n=1 Tax=Skeletonema marinoi TaxID=267567 RepID=A0AAD8YFH8_9STRA|nr:helicase-associated domain-containing protein [Skeletonema marinoi]
MSKESPPPSPSKVAAAAAASAAVEPDFDIVVPSLGPDATLEQRQLAEFNQWSKKGSINTDKWMRRYEELSTPWRLGQENAPYQKRRKTYRCSPEVASDIGFEFDKPKGGGKKVVFSGVWNKAYLELCDYQDEHGNIERQRTAFKAGKLDNDLIQKLEEVGVDLSGRARPFGYELDADWTSTYKELKKYSDANGNCNVPEGDGNLGAWVKAQRTYRQQRSLGFRFSELQAYHKVHGDTNVPRYFPLNLALGEFVHDLRTGYQHGALTEGRKKLLKDIGFTFVTSKGRKNTNKWDTTFEELKRYKAKHGTIDIPDSDKSNVVLAGWVSRQRRYQRDQTLKKDRYEKLKAFGFDSEYQAIVEFKEEHGHLKIPTNYEPNPSLYFWVGTQRQSYKHGKLSEERIEKLTELGIDLEIQQSRERPKGKSGPAFLNPKEWDRCFDCLVKYKEEHGDCNVSQREEKDRLGSFCHYMRYYHKQGKLSDEQTKKLADIGFSFNIIDSRWSDKYEELVAFNEENGSCDVPLGHSLYAWVMYQRQAFKNGKLAEDRTDLLRKINFKLEVASRASRKSTGEATSPTVAEKVDRDEYLAELWEKSYNEMVDTKRSMEIAKFP